MIKHIWFDFSDTLALVNKDTGVAYGIPDKNIPEILVHMSKIIPISIFSNGVDTNDLSSVGIDHKLFTHILSAKKLGVLKPALDGFYKVIELSGVSPEEILYIGDELEKDIIPAKTVGIKTGVVFMTSHEADYSFADFKDILKFVEKNF